jgi:hypothetical protein
MLPRAKMIAVIAMAIHMRFRKKSQKFTGLVATEDSIRKGKEDSTPLA